MGDMIPAGAAKLTRLPTRERHFCYEAGECVVCHAVGNVWADGGLPLYCDRCEIRLRVIRDYRDNPLLAERIYCAANPRDALILMGEA